MDANGTRFHLLLGQSDWGACVTTAEPPTPLRAAFEEPLAQCADGHAASGFAWDDARQQVTLGPCVAAFEAAPNDRPPDPGGADRRGAARDRFGNFYWIAESRTELRIISVASGVPVHFWSAGDAPVRPHRYGEFHAAEAMTATPAVRLCGLALTDDHYLVVGSIEPAGLLVFDLHAGGAPQQLCWDPPFVPFDMSPRRGGGAWILDRANRRYWGVDRNFRPLALGGAPEEIDSVDDFQPATGSARRRAGGRRVPHGIALASIAATAGLDPIAIEGLPDGSVLLLVNAGDGSSRLFRDGAADQFGEPQAVHGFRGPAYDIAFVPKGEGDRVTGRLYAAAPAGNQAYVFEVREEGGALSASLAAEYRPMRLFGGKALLASPPDVFYDFFEAWIPLEVQRRPRYAASATLLTPVFDGREPACVWHRLMIDACIPPDAAVRVRSRAADDRGDLAVTAWQPEPAPYLRRDGSELPFGHRRRSEHDGTWELLFQRARGRYLQLEVTFEGNERVTPRVQALRAYYPRFSYLTHYLPAVYRDDEDSASFLDRFLANVEGFCTATEDRVAAAQVLFDVRSAPSDALDWLGSWFGVALDPTWTDEKRRLFLKHAIDFFRQRGTVRGVRAALRLALDPCADPSIFEESHSRRRRRGDAIRLVERYRTRKLPAAVAGDPTEIDAPREVAAEARWRPEQGRERLLDLYATSFREAGLAGGATSFPVRAPQDATRAQHWRQFARDVLGFVPSAASAADRTAWREFLARRYHHTRALARAYGLPSANVPALDAIELPQTLPADGAPLADWFDFESIVLATRRTAHRFSVLLPVSRVSGESAEQRQQRLDLVKRIVDLEKPAHTVFDVKFYWALFRLGEARLGDDTIADRGGRAPELLPPLRLGDGALAESYLAPGHPHDVTERTIVGRDRLPTDAEERHV